jgi:hypothetical protein
MVLCGLVLLLPGLCALLFASTGYATREISLLLLWLVCFAISVGGIVLIVKAFR